NSKQFLMRIRTLLTGVTKMTLSVILRRSRRACPELAEGIWPANDEILRFALRKSAWGRLTTESFGQNDSNTVSFENLNIRILNLFRISNFVLRAFPFSCLGFYIEKCHLLY
ncbi:MAG: hypothetical protein ABIL62_04140, partial [Planctomycetota bacterium]